MSLGGFPNKPGQGSTATASPPSAEEKELAEKKRLFEAEMKRAQEALKQDGKDIFVRQAALSASR